MKTKKVWLVVIKSEVLHSIYIPAKNADEAQKKVEASIRNDSRDPINRAISDSLKDVDEILEQDVFEVEPTRMQGA